jgi:N-acyl-D-aspartate/D-glutamate deacylase
MAEYLARFDSQISPNVACLVGHGTVRMQVMGMDDRAPSDDERRAMGDRPPNMVDGAVGLSAADLRTRGVLERRRSWSTCAGHLSRGAGTTSPTIATMARERSMRMRRVSISDVERVSRCI